MYIGIQQYRDKPYYHKLHNSTHTRTWRFRHTTYQPPPPRTKATILQWSSRSQAPSSASSPSAATVPSPRGAPSACRPALRAGTRGGRLPALRFLRQRPPCPLWPCTLQQTCDMAYVHRVPYGHVACDTTCLSTFPPRWRSTRCPRRRWPPGGWPCAPEPDRALSYQDEVIGRTTVSSGSTVSSSGPATEFKRA